MVTQSDSAEHSANLALVKALYAAIAGNKAESIVSHLSPDFVLTEAEGLPYGGVYKGPSGFMDLWRKLGDWWQDFRPVDFEYLAGEGSVAVVIQLEGISRKSGGKFSQKIVELWKIRGDRIVEGTVFYFDTHAVRQVCAL